MKALLGGLPETHTKERRRSLSPALEKAGTTAVTTTTAARRHSVAEARRGESNVIPSTIATRTKSSSIHSLSSGSEGSSSPSSSQDGKVAAKTIFEKIFGASSTNIPASNEENSTNIRKLSADVSPSASQRGSTAGEPITLDLRATYQRLLQKKAHTQLTWTEMWQFAIADVIRTHRGAQMFVIKRKPAREEIVENNDNNSSDANAKNAQNKGRTASEVVNFRVSDYLACSTVIITPEMRETLDKPRYLYTEKDYALIMRLCSRIKSFGKYNSHLQKRLCHCIQYSQFGPGRVIVKQGHRATAFYFIINGQVQVYKTDNDIKIVLSHLSAGDSFGELALIKKMNRTASVVCKTLTEFFWIDEVDFLKVLKTTSDEDNFNKQEFFKSQVLYDGISQAQIFKQCDAFVKKDTTTNEVIIKQCEHINSIYFLRTGSVRILKIVPFLKIPIGNANFRYQATNLTSSTACPAFAASFAGRFKSKSADQSSPKSIESPKKSNMVAIRPTIIHKLLCVKVLLPGSYFGEECLFGTETQLTRPEDQDEIQILCPYTVVTCEPCELFRVTRSEFLKTTSPNVVAAMESRKPLRDLELNVSRIQESYIRTLAWLGLKEKIIKQKQQALKVSTQKRSINILEHSAAQALSAKK